MSNAAPPEFARALGRIPSGLFVVTTRRAGEPLGFVGSFVQQVGFEPPTVSVAVGKGRAPLDAIRSSKAFALSVLDPASEKVMGRFFKRYEPGQSPFEGLATSDAPSGSPVLAEALAWVDCRLAGEHELADHVVLFGAVLDGRVLREGDPSVHLRRNGLSY
jgi:3-hydroxy-9,10-secoandrosta-1,3,5(10)-triene-9,17-dione monooxygenase reductase component